MTGPLWPPSRFWQFWAIAGMLVLTGAFWWGVEGYALFEGGYARSQIADGLLRFSLLVLTPALVLVWLVAGWLRRRVGEGGRDMYRSWETVVRRLAHIHMIVRMHWRLAAAAPG